MVNNCAAAVLLAVNTLAEGRDVLVSRGELVEIGGSFRIPDVVKKGGARLVEVGTTNRTRLADFEAALTSATGLILKVHPSNFRIVGFTEEPRISELAALAREGGDSLWPSTRAAACIASTPDPSPTSPRPRAGCWKEPTSSPSAATSCSGGRRRASWPAGEPRSTRCGATRSTARCAWTR